MFKSVIAFLSSLLSDRTMLPITPPSSKKSKRKREQTLSPAAPGRKRERDATTTETEIDGEERHEQQQPSASLLLPSALLAKETPFVHMRLEILDTDNIWSPGHLVEVVVQKVRGNRHQKKLTTTFIVTVAFDGWGRQWEEQLEWGHERLAPLFTYTKRAKCMVEMISLKSRKLSKKGRTSSSFSVWPCIVSIRMPHPASPEQGELGLRLEQKIFCQPYHSELLPPAIRDTLKEDNGCWYPFGRLRSFKADPNVNGTLSQGFMVALEKAQQDTDVDVLCKNAFEKGTSLLNPHLRVIQMDGAKIRDGRLVSLLPPAKLPLAKIQRVRSPPPAIVKIPKEISQAPPIYHPPPTLPQGISINEPLYPGVTKCGNEWTASLAASGNYMFLGNFPTQTQAHQALIKATGGSDTSVETDLDKAMCMDLVSIPMEDIISAFEEQYNPLTHSFSIHKWTLDKVSHYCYLREKERYEGRSSTPKKQTKAEATLEGILK